MALDVEQIVRAALGLLNEDGIDGLTTRRLAAALNVKGPALYHHFANKGELLGHMVAVLLLDSFEGIDWQGDWAQVLRTHAISLRKVLLRYRDSARVMVASSPTEVLKLAIMPKLTQPVIEAGLDPEAASEALATLASFTNGWLLNEQNEAIRHLMETVLNMDKAYLAGVEIIISGINQKISSRTRLSKPKARRTASEQRHPRTLKT